jgi:peptidoglycan/xylan/chitin deacetylase (PgdA/CDA1 family)
VSLHGRREGLPVRTVLIPVEPRQSRRVGRWLFGFLGLLVVATAVATAVALLRDVPVKTASRPPAAPAPTPLPRPRPRLPSAAELLARQRQRAVTRLSGLGVPVFCGGSAGNDVALTFDDGPGPDTTRLLAALRRGHAEATFFLVGNRIRYWPAVPAEETAIGAVGDHTWSHADLTRLPRRVARSEIDRPLAAIGGRVRLFRTPYGREPAWLGRYLASRGMLEIRWSVDTDDYLPRATATTIVRRAMQGLRPGAILLLHDNHPATIRALPRLLALIHARHLRAVTVPELLRGDPPSYPQLMADNRGRGCVDLATAGRE